MPCVHDAEGAIGFTLPQLHNIVQHAEEVDHSSERIIWLPTTRDSRAQEVEGVVQTVLADGKVVIDHAQQLLVIEEKEHRIAPREFATLEVLSKDLGKWVTRRTILEEVWENPLYDLSNVSVVAGRLKKRFGAYGELMQSMRDHEYCLRRDLPGEGKREGGIV